MSSLSLLMQMGVFLFRLSCGDLPTIMEVPSLVYGISIWADWHLDRLAFVPGSCHCPRGHLPVCDQPTVHL